MKFSASWLFSHLDTKCDIPQLTNAMNMLGIEVTRISSFSYFSLQQDIVIGYIKKCERMANSKKLSICTVDIGEQDNYQVVCGAPNVRPGIFIAYIKIGGIVPRFNFQISNKIINNVQSSGMICSEHELCLGYDNRGIMIFGEDNIEQHNPASSNLLFNQHNDSLIHNSVYHVSVFLGKSIYEYLEYLESFNNNVIFDVVLPIDRPDLLSVRGIARELHVAGIGKLKDCSDFYKDIVTQTLELKYIDNNNHESIKNNDSASDGNDVQDLLIEESVLMKNNNQIIDLPHKQTMIKTLKTCHWDQIQCVESDNVYHLPPNSCLAKIIFYDDKQRVSICDHFSFYKLNWMYKLLAMIKLTTGNTWEDIAQFISLDCGRPLHVHDLRKSNGLIYFDITKDQESFVDRCDQAYLLPENLHITRAEITIDSELRSNNIICLPNIVYGKQLACDENTSAILVESITINNQLAGPFVRKNNLCNTSYLLMERGMDPSTYLLGLTLFRQFMEYITNKKPTKCVLYYNKQNLTKKTLFFAPGDYLYIAYRAGLICSMNLGMLNKTKSISANDSIININNVVTICQCHNSSLFPSHVFSLRSIRDMVQNVLWNIGCELAAISVVCMGGGCFANMANMKCVISLSSLRSLTTNNHDSHETVAKDNDVRCVCSKCSIDKYYIPFWRHDINHVNDIVQEILKPQFVADNDLHNKKDQENQKNKEGNDIENATTQGTSSILLHHDSHEANSLSNALPINVLLKQYIQKEVGTYAKCVANDNKQYDNNDNKKLLHFIDLQEQQMITQLKLVLCSLGFDEMMNKPLLHDNLKKWALSVPISIVNPVVKEYSVLKFSAVLPMLQAIDIDYIKYMKNMHFEIGTIFVREDACVIDKAFCQQWKYHSFGGANIENIEQSTIGTTTSMNNMNHVNCYEQKILSFLHFDSDIFSDWHNKQKQSNFDIMYIKKIIYSILPKNCVLFFVKPQTQHGQIDKSTDTCAINEADDVLLCEDKLCKTTIHDLYKMASNVLPLYYVASQSCVIFDQNKKVIGFCGRLQKELLTDMNLEVPCVAAELSLDFIVQQRFDSQQSFFASFNKILPHKMLLEQEHAIEKSKHELLSKESWLGQASLIDSTDNHNSDASDNIDSKNIKKIWTPNRLICRDISIIIKNEIYSTIILDLLRQYSKLDGLYQLEIKQAKIIDIYHLTTNQMSICIQIILQIYNNNDHSQINKAIDYIVELICRHTGAVVR